MISQYRFNKQSDRMKSKIGGDVPDAEFPPRVAFNVKWSDNWRTKSSGVTGRPLLMFLEKLDRGYGRVVIQRVEKIAVPTR